MNNVTSVATQREPVAINRTDVKDNVRQNVVQSGNSQPSVKAEVSTPPVDSASLAEAVRAVSARFDMASTSLSISVDEQLGSTIIEVKDSETQEVIRQIPPEQIVSLARFLRESEGVGGFELADTMKGLLLESSG
ncbi:MAG: flagellar protein FlaG [Luminiphilus sp.]|nr:flagellar protein FlaG [Luminiphilus sp.]